MLSPNDQVAEAVGTIRAAFAETTRGTGTTLEEAELHDRCASETKLQEARDRTIDVHWWQIPDDELRGWGASIHFLDEAGYLYYLPALMTWVLTLSQQWYYWEPATLPLLSSLGHVRKRVRPCQYVDSMTSEQREAVVAFLRAAVAVFGCEDAQTLLDGLWAVDQARGAVDVDGDVEPE